MSHLCYPCFNPSCAISFGTIKTLLQLNIRSSGTTIPSNELKLDSLLLKTTMLLIKAPNENELCLDSANIYEAQCTQCYRVPIKYKQIDCPTQRLFNVGDSLEIVIKGNTNT